MLLNKLSVFVDQFALETFWRKIPLEILHENIDTRQHRMQNWPESSEQNHKLSANAVLSHLCIFGFCQQSQLLWGK